MRDDDLNSWALGREWPAPKKSTPQSMPGVHAPQNYHLGLHCNPVRQGSLPSAHTKRNGSSETKRLSQELTLVRWALQRALDGFSKLLENYP